MLTNGSPLDRLHHRLSEACGALWDSFVDPAEAYLDYQGRPWVALGGDGDASARCSYQGPEELRDLRDQCRMLAVTNEFAINGHENRVSYTIGVGHSYRVAPRKGRNAPDGLSGQAQEVLDEFLVRNQWHRRQREIMHRTDRDGEVFLRLFVDSQGTTRVRFVEPDQIATPAGHRDDPSASFGIQTDPHDVETVRAYYVDSQPVDAAEIQHRKANVDSNVKRGLPLYAPVRKNLRRAEKLLRNMSVVAEIQSAIALIRKHRGATHAGVQQFAAASADASVTDSVTGQTSTFRRYGPGTILDAPGGVEYDFPTSGIDAATFVTVLQAELRAIAARLVMPEFMLTSDASNANFSSTMVAEGPAIKMFARLQSEQIAYDREIMWQVLEGAVRAGRLPAEARGLVEIQITAPSLGVRDALQDAKVARIEFDAGILSSQTWSQRSGLDYDQEQENRIENASRQVAETDQ